jgi:general secretion pathway protein D
VKKIIWIFLLVISEAKSEMMPEMPDRLFQLNVVNVSAKELLYTLMHDAGVDCDIHPALTAKVSLVAKNQTVTQILHRVAAQADLRFFARHGRLVIEPDQPYMQRYSIDYLNIQRTMALKTQIVSSVLNNEQGKLQNGIDNTSSMVLQGSSDNQFWLRFRLMLCQHLSSTPSRWHAPSCGAAEAGDVTIYPEVGLVNVYGTQRQQQAIEHLIQEIVQRARQQVLIEATIVEVELDKQYEAGIDWSLLLGGGVTAGGKWLANNMATAPFFLFSGGSSRFQTLIKALESFGQTRVLSSPRVMALNNQTAILKVVNEEIYFTLQLKEDFNRDGDVRHRKFESQLHTVPVGLVMNVTPQIGKDKTVSLHIRPSITSIGGYKEDPAVSLYASAQNLAVKSQVPILQVREFDSMLLIPDQHIAVLGGLIRDEYRQNVEGMPFLGRVPGLGALFRHERQQKKKSELIVFLRPHIVMPEGEVALDGQLAQEREVAGAR